MLNLCLLKVLYHNIFMLGITMNQGNVFKILFIVREIQLYLKI